MFIDAELELIPGYGWQGGPEFTTTVKALRSGEERRNAEAAYPRHRYLMPMQNIAGDMYLQKLKDAFLVARGRTHSFKIKDHSDYTLTNEYIGVGDGTKTAFQITKTSTFGSQTYTRLITKPVAGLVVYVDGVATAATVDVATGVVTFAAAPADGAIIRVTGEFRVCVRFTSDSLMMSLDNRFRDGRAAMNGTVELVEVYE